MTTYFAQNAYIEAKMPGSTEYAPVGIVQEVRIETQVEVTKLYGFGSIKRQAAARHTLANSVTVSTASFTRNFGDWFWRILNENGASGDIGAMSVSYADTTKVPLFQITGYWMDDQNDAPIYGTAIDVYFTNLPWGGALGEYIILALTGEARDVVFSQTAPAGWTSPSGRVTIDTTPIAIDTTSGTATITMTGLTGTDTVSFGVANTSVATVSYASGSSSALVTAVHNGQTNVIATINGNVNYIPVTVTNNT